MNKATVASALFFCLLLPGCATAPGKCLLANCPENGRVVYQYNHGAIYDGEVVRGKAQGKGTATWPNGMTYVGDFSDGEARGRGIMTSPDGYRVVGEFQNNLIHGQADAVLPAGTVIPTTDGKGVKIPVGVSITGTWSNGHILTGKATWADGRAYNGAWVAWKRQAQGTTTYSDGTTACGQWNDTAPVILYTPEQFNAIRPTGSCAK